MRLVPWPPYRPRPPRYPPGLPAIGDDVVLLVASGPGPTPESWVKAAPGMFYAWPGQPTEDLHAEQMTAAELRALIASRHPNPNTPASATRPGR